MKRKLIIVGDSEPSIYSLRTIGEVTRLFTSKLGDWAPRFKGKVAAKVTDTGNNLHIECAHPAVIELDYSEAFELYLILRNKFQTDQIREFEEL